MKRVDVKGTGPTSAKSKKKAPASKSRAGKGSKGAMTSRGARARAKERQRAKAVAAELVATSLAAAQLPAAKLPTAEPAVSVTPESVLIDGKRFYAVAEPLGVLCSQPAMLEAPDMVVPFFAARNRLTLLSAREKAGKSTLMAYIVAQLSRGGDLWGSPTAPQKLLWVGLEEWIGDCARRFMRMQADGKNVCVVRSLGSDPLAQLKAEIMIGKPSLVIIDSLSRFASGMDDENNASVVNKILSPLVDFIHGCGAAVLLLHHGTKSGGGYRGSGAIGAQVDVIMEMVEDPQDPTQRNFQARGRIEIPSFSLRYNAETASFDHLGAGPSPEAIKEKAQVDLAHRVVEHARENPGNGSNAIRRAVGGRGADVDLALKSLVTAGTLRHLGRRKGYVVATA